MVKQKILKVVGNWLFDILFNERCLGCQARGSMLCSFCLSRIEEARFLPEKNIFAIFDYRNKILRDAIWELKYRHNHHLGKLFGKILYDLMLEKIYEIREFSPRNKIVVIPVPITRKKNNFRGYNQSLVIALAFCKSSVEKIFELRKNIIKKKINTIPQAKIKDRKERLKNVIGSFCVKRPELIKGRTVIVIDDVITTRATIREVMKILRKSGAKKVFGFAIAH